MRGCIRLEDGWAAMAEAGAQRRILLDPRRVADQTAQLPVRRRVPDCPQAGVEHVADDPTVAAFAILLGLPVIAARDDVAVVLDLEGEMRPRAARQGFPRLGAEDLIATGRDVGVVVQIAPVICELVDSAFATPARRLLELVQVVLELDELDLDLGLPLPKLLAQPQEPLQIVEHKADPPTNACQLVPLLLQ